MKANHIFSIELGDNVCLLELRNNTNLVLSLVQIVKNR